MKKLLSLAVSLGLLALLYWQLSRHGQLHELARVFRDCDRAWLALALALVVPVTLLTARRLQQLMPRPETLTFGEASRLILLASTLNLILPSKMGDITKAWFMKERGRLEGSLAFALVVFEKSCDMLSLLLWCAFGLLLYPSKDALFWTMTAAVGGAFLGGLLLLGRARVAGFFFRAARWERFGESWREMHAYFWSSKKRLARIAFTSLFIWFLHLLQIWMFIRALKAFAPFLANLALSPLALLAGLLPLTFAGVGTRDAALIYFYRPYFAPPTAAALGLLCTTRYLLPALGGLPFFVRAKRVAPESRENR